MSSKSSQVAPMRTGKSRSSRKDWLAAPLLAALALVAWLGWRQSPSWTVRRPSSIWNPELPESHGSSGKPYTDWDSIPASQKLSWVPCFPTSSVDHLCARLTVPMDYNRPLKDGDDESTRHPKVHLALMMLPGQGHSLDTGDFSVSPLILNPGGPGGSGVKFLEVAGQGIQAALGRHRDILSFDPRGVGASWPQADCFLDDHTPEDPPSTEELNHALLRRVTFALEMQEIGLANSTDVALGLTVTRSTARSRLCGAKDGEASIFRHVGTPNSARDLLSIVDAWDAWRDGLSAGGLQQAPGSRPCMEQPSGLADDEGSTSALDTRGKLVYWGFSYGTVLGSTFAAMFPDRVGRLVLDGVVDSDVYRKEIFPHAIRDTDAVLDGFFQFCLEARQKCFFYQNDASPEDMKRRYLDLLAKLEETPMIVIPNQVRMPVVIRATDLKSAVFTMLGFPVAAFPTLALLLFTMERRLDMSLLVSTPDLSPLCSARLALYPEESPSAIACSDRRQNWQEGLDDLQVTFEKMAEESSFADLWMLAVTACSGWGITPQDPPGFKVDKLPTGDRPPINTSFPLLFLSNTHDPLTPMHQGLLMSRRFAGAGFVEQLSNGHCSLAEISLCTLGRIRAYLDEGVVPPPPPPSHTAAGSWARCESDEKPWRRFGQQQQKRQSGGWAYAQEDVDIMQKSWPGVREGFRRFVGSQELPGAKVLRRAVEMEGEEAESIFGLLSGDLGWYRV